MHKKMSKSRLAMILSRMEGFNAPKVRQEQYLMDSEIGASVLWHAYLLGDIDNKVIVDLGCGTGILGIGAMLMGAKHVIFVETDKDALEIAKNNILKVKSETYTKGTAELICNNIGDVLVHGDVVMQNPPFGTKVKHSDLLFLKQAIITAPILYSFHKSETTPFLERFSAKHNLKISHNWRFRFPLKASLPFHRRQIHRIDVSCFRFERL